MIRVGFIGCGLIASLHTFLLSTAEVDHRIVAVCDLDPKRAAHFAEVCGAEVTDEHGVLDAVDAVFITTWTSEHRRLVEAAAAKGVAIFCEKPLATNLTDVEAMIEAVERAGVINQVGLILRFLAPFRLARKLLADPRAGRTLGVTFRDDQYLPVGGTYRSDWRVDVSKAGHGTVLEHSIHDLDILGWMLGPMQSLSATTRQVHGHPGIEDVAAVRMDFVSGATATLSSVWHDIIERESQRRVEIFCERLYVHIAGDFVGPVTWQFTGEDEMSLFGEALADAVVADDHGNPARAFLTAVAEKRAATPNFADALAAHRVVAAVYRSAELAGAVEAGFLD